MKLLHSATTWDHHPNFPYIPLKSTKDYGKPYKKGLVSQVSYSDSDQPLTHEQLLPIVQGEIGSEAIISYRFNQKGQKIIIAQTGITHITKRIVDKGMRRMEKIDFSTSIYRVNPYTGQCKIIDAGKQHDENFQPENYTWTKNNLSRCKTYERILNGVMSNKLLNTRFQLAMFTPTFPDSWSIDQRIEWVHKFVDNIRNTISPCVICAFEPHKSGKLHAHIKLIMTREQVKLWKQDGKVMRYALDRGLQVNSLELTLAKQNRYKDYLGKPAESCYLSKDKDDLSIKGHRVFMHYGMSHVKNFDLETQKADSVTSDDWWIYQSALIAKKVLEFHGRKVPEKVTKVIEGFQAYMPEEYITAEELFHHNIQKDEVQSWNLLGRVQKTKEEGIPKGVFQKTRSKGAQAKIPKGVFQKTRSKGAQAKIHEGIP